MICAIDTVSVQEKKKKTLAWDVTDNMVSAQNPSNLILKHNKREWQEEGMLARILRRRLQGHLNVKHKLVVLLSIINSILSNSVCLGTYLSHGLCRWQTLQWTLMYPLRATKLQYINYKQAENSNFMLKYKDSLMCWILEHSILNSNNNKRLKKKNLIPIRIQTQ